MQLFLLNNYINVLNKTYKLFELEKKEAEKIRKKEEEAKRKKMAEYYIGHPDELIKDCATGYVSPKQEKSHKLGEFFDALGWLMFMNK